MIDWNRVGGRARDWILLVLASVAAALGAIVLGGLAAGGMLQTALQVGLENRALPVGTGFGLLAILLGLIYVLLPPTRTRARRDSTTSGTD